MLDFKPGDDLSYYLGPDATCATQEQCDELKRTFRDAHEQIKAIQHMKESK